MYSQPGLSGDIIRYTCIYPYNCLFYLTFLGYIEYYCIGSDVSNGHGGTSQMFMQPIPHDSSVNEVLIIGGCHVNGWKIGTSPCFWDGAAEYWSDGQRVTRHGYVSFKKVAKLLAGHDVDPQGTLLILQLGNFEAQQLAIARPLFSHVLKIFRRDTIARDNDLKKADTGEAAILAKKDEAKLWVTGAILLSIEMLIPRAFRKRRVNSVLHQLNGMLEYVVAANARHTIMLSAFPTISPVNNYYRKILNRFMRSHAEDRGFTYIDAFAVLKDAKARGDLAAGPLFADGLHLAPLGHALISKAITERLDTEYIANRYAFERIAA